MGRNLRIVIVIFCALLMVGGAWKWRDLKKTSAGQQGLEINEKAGDSEDSKKIKDDGIQDNIAGADDRREPLRVEDVSFSRVSDKEIEIVWSDRMNPYVEEYIVKRRKSEEEQWQILSSQSSDGISDGRELIFTDTLDESVPQQYEYRIDIETIDDALYEAIEGKSVLASNILICIDPGHYAGQNTTDSDGIIYAEGDFTLELAKELQRILRDSCGITAYLTRESGSISIGGYTDGGLDGSHISLRGEYAAGSNLFLSLHTNANLEGANGYATDSQPIELMKPIIIANTIACENGSILEVGNAVGQRLAESSCEMGIAVPDKFQRAESVDDIVLWTDAWNDGLDTSGSICRRMGEHGDYYGVLRGAANVGVPGMIIEHGFHTVPEMRRLAIQGDLKVQWARADARGIAEGYGIEYKGVEE